MARRDTARHRDRRMPRAPRIALAGLTYHVWANGASGTTIFRDAVDKDVMLLFLGEEVLLSGWICLEYVVMERTTTWSCIRQKQR
jgi:hypothetical protein